MNVFLQQNKTPMQHKALCVSLKAVLEEIDGELIGPCAPIYKLPLHSDLHTQRVFARQYISSLTKQVTSTTDMIKLALA